MKDDLQKQTKPEWKPTACCCASEILHIGQFFRALITFTCDCIIARPGLYFSRHSSGQIFKFWIESLYWQRRE